MAGVVALVRSRYPDLDAANVFNRLIRTARDVGVPGRDPEFGFGTVDVLAALQRPVPAVDGNPLLVAGAPPGGATVAPTGTQTERPAGGLLTEDIDPLRLSTSDCGPASTPAGDPFHGSVRACRA
ncbi:hypothetical protein ACIBCL_19230 [Micromonospora zamorensis]|uniref:hypothetical protein n=1 Tax=Micromonospora zamorensis TaxID=709883 RepID=UPI00378BFD74